MKKDKAFQIISFVLLAAAVIGTVIFVNARMECLLNADDASEMVLGRLLSEENSLVSTHWFYSTEIRIINTQIFYALFHKIFTDWHMVRMASYLCLYACLGASYLFLLIQTNSKKYFAITAGILFIPFSVHYFDIILRGVYYIPHVAITLLTLALAELYIKVAGSTLKNVKANLVLAGTVILSLFAGMGGARQVVVLHAPLVMAVLIITILDAIKAGKKAKGWEGTKAYLIFGVANFIAGIAGYIINTKILVKVFHFMKWDSIHPYISNMDRIKEIFMGYIRCLGFSDGNISTRTLVLNTLPVAWMVLTVFAVIYALVKKDSKSPLYRIAWFFVSAVVCYTGLYTFTDMAISDRYAIPGMVMTIPLLAMFFNEFKCKEIIKYIVSGVFVLGLLMGGALYYRSSITQDNTYELRQIAKLASEQGITGGYSSFWNGNIITEFSDGQIEMWTIATGTGDYTLSEVTDINTIYPWLQKTSHATKHPDGKVMLLFTRGEYNNNNFKTDDNMQNIIYESDNYVVIAYDNYGALVEDISN